MAFGIVLVLPKKAMADPIVLLNNDTIICVGDSITLSVERDTVLVDQFIFDYTAAINISTVGTVQGEHYFFKMSGDYTGAGAAQRRDAAFYFKYNWQNVQLPVGSFDWNGVSNNRPNPDIYNPSHVYYFPFIGDGLSQSLTWNDTNYGDNNGSISVEMYMIKSIGIWSTGDTAFEIKVSPINSTFYYVHGLDGSGRDSIEVNVFQRNSNLLDSVSQCNGDSVLLISNNCSNIAWSTHDHVDSLWVLYSDPYYLQALDSNNCILDDTIQVSLIKTLISQLDTTICAGDSVELSVQDIEQKPLVYFDGLNDFIQIPHSASFLFDRNFTLSAWVKPDKLTGFQAIVNKVSNHAEKQFSLQLKGDSLIFDYETGGNDFHMIHEGIGLDWHHVAVSVDDHLLVKMYIDGALVSTTVAPASPSDLTSDLMIGKLGGNYNSNFFKGSIKDVRVWTRVLSDFELLESVCHHVNPFKEADLLAYWLHQQGQDNYVWDLTGKGLDGLPYGPTWYYGLSPCVSSKTFLWEDSVPGDLFSCVLWSKDTICLQVSNSQITCYDTVVLDVKSVNLDLDSMYGVCESDSVYLSVDSSFDAYAWNTGDTSFSLWVKDTDSLLMLHVYDSFGCIGIDSAFVNILERPSWLTNDSLICPGSQAGVSISLPYNYDSLIWSSGSLNSMQSFIPLTDTTISVQLWTSDSLKSCLFTDSFHFFLKPAIGLSDTILYMCEGDSLSLIHKGVYSNYLWSTGSQDSSLLVTDTATYTLKLTDTAMCEDSMLFNVFYYNLSNPLPQDSLKLCDFTSASIQASLGYLQYDWDSGGVNSNLSVQSVGSYGLEVIDSNGCKIRDAVEVILEESNIELFVFDSLYCRGGQAEIYLYGRSTVDSLNWIGGGSDTAFLIVNQDTTLTLHAWKGDSLCMFYDTIQILKTELTFNPEIRNVDCHGNSTAYIKLNVHGGKGHKTYYWSSGFNSDSVGGLLTGNYSITVWDSLGCFRDTSINITEPSSFVVNHQKNDVNCPNDSSGAIQLNLIGGVKPYQIAWLHNSIDSTQIGLTAGLYKYTVSDSNGCSQNDSIFIHEAPQFNAQFQLDHVLCYGENSGQINLFFSGGTPPYNYQWSNGSSFNLLPSLYAGIYNLILKDSLNCIYDTSIVINEPDSFKIEPVSMEEHCGLSDGYISLRAVGGKKPYSYNWSSGHTVDSVWSLSAGLYIVTITDLNQCVITDTFSIHNRPKPEIDFKLDDICIGEVGEVSSIDTANTIEYWYWYDGDGNLLQGDSVELNYTDTGVYFVELIAVDSFSCSDTAIKVLNVYPLPDISMSKDTSWGCGELCVSFSALNNLDTNSRFYWTYESHGSDSTSFSEYCFNQVGDWDVYLSVVSEHACTNSLVMADWIQVFPVPKADFIADPFQTDIVDANIVFTDLSIGASLWHWEFGDGFTDSLSSPSHLYTDTGTHKVQLIVNNSFSCGDTIVKDIIIRGRNVMYMPNAFTPGKDGVNDVFLPVGLWNDVSFYSFSIWNRWGKKLFETQDPHIGWDGYCSNEKDGKCQQGGYLYKLSYSDMYGAFRDTMGTFLLIRDAPKP